MAVDDIDVLIESDKEPVVIDDAPPSDIDRAIAEHVRAFVPDGATLQTGIGAVPSVVAALLAEGDGGGYGIHSEMFTTGLMRLHRGRQGHEPEGHLRRRLRRDLRGRHPRALRLAPREPTRSRSSPSTS